MGIKLSIGSIIFLFIWACSGSNESYGPKPKGFNRIDMPPTQYQPLIGNYPYTFQYSRAAIVELDKTPGAEPYWIKVVYPKLNAQIQFTYKPLNGDLNKLNKHVADAYKLAAKHQIKATSQTESVLNLPNGKKAVVIQIEGEVPSHYQFYITDTTKNFLRGAVYLEKSTINDSLLPVVNYLKKDCRYLLETIKWK